MWAHINLTYLGRPAPKKFKIGENYEKSIINLHAGYGAFKFCFLPRWW